METINRSVGLACANKQVVKTSQVSLRKPWNKTTQIAVPREGQPPSQTAIRRGRDLLCENTGAVAARSPQVNIGTA